MNFRQALGEVVKEQRLAKGLTLRSLSSNGYISLGYLSEVERGQNEVSSSVIENIANGLGVDSYELIIKAGYRMADLEIPETPESLFAPSQFAHSR